MRHDLVICFGMGPGGVGRGPNLMAWLAEKDKRKFCSDRNAHI
jgi:hypothetical protein